MEKFLNKIKKSIAVLTATSLLISFVVGPTAASAINNEQPTKEYNQIFKEFILPYSYGKITKSHFAGTDRVIINIQDLHCHSKVQKNISNIIKIFDEKYGISNIYLEGAYGDVSTKWITDKIKDDKSLLEKMLDTGRLTGAEYYSALSSKTELIKGLEEKEPFLENITRLGDLLQNQPKINLILEELGKSINDVKKKYYTKRQYKIERLFKDYKDGKIVSQKYYTLLSKHIDKLGIDLSKYENTFIYLTLLDLQKELDYKKIKSQLQSLISILKQHIPYSVYKSLLENTSNFQEIEKLYSYIVQLDKVYDLNISLQFKELDKYFKYIELSKKINPIELVKEDEFLSQEINTRFSQTKVQKEVVFLVHFEKFLRDYLSTKITPDDYVYYKENIDSFRQIYNKYVDNRVLSLLDEYIAKTDKFYEVNIDRNIYFTNNMFEENSALSYIDQPKLSENDTNEIIENMQEVKQLDIVITGGFHSQTVTELLDKRNISYIVITPNVTDGIKVAEDIYYEIAKQESTISFQTIAPLIASLSPKLQNILLQKITSPEQIEQIMEADDVERAQLISELVAAKLLESDDLGNVKEKIQEVIKDIVDDLHKEKVTPETVSKIKNIQQLLNNKEKLQIVIDLLHEGTIKQSVTLLSNMFDELYGIFDSFVFAAEKNLEQQEKISSRKDVLFDEYEDTEDYGIDKEGTYDGDYEYDYFDDLELWFSDEDIIDLCREIIRAGQYNKDIEDFIWYLGKHNMADYELLNKILAELKSVNNKEIRNEYCGVIYALIDKDKNKSDEEKALKTKEKIMSFFEKPKLIQLKFCEFFSIVSMDYNDFIKEGFFDALMDVVNNKGYKDRDFELLFEIMVDSRFVAELGTRENIYDLLNLSIEKRKLVYEFYKSFRDDFNVKVNQLTLNFILSVLNKYDFTKEQFSYIMKLICSVGLTDNDNVAKEYIKDLKEKDVNLFILEQFMYRPVYNKYTVDLLFSDVDEKHKKIIVYNIQKIIDLFNNLQKYQIDTLETENKGLALAVFSSIGFERYCEEKNIEDLVKQYQLAIRVSRRMYAIAGDKLFTISNSKIENIIKETLKYYEKIDEIISLLTLFTNKTAVFSLHNSERNLFGKGFRFTPAGIKEIFKKLEIEPEVFETIEISFMDKILDFINETSQNEIDKQTLLDFVNNLDGSITLKKDILDYISRQKDNTLSKRTFNRYINRLKTTEPFVEANRFLKFIEHFNDYGQEKGVFIFDGHGLDDRIFYSDTGSISVERISQALINAHKNGVNLENLTLMFSSCHSYKFADNIINELMNNGITVFPQIITDAGKETVYGYTKVVDMDGEQVKVSNLFYSLLEYLKSKTSEEIQQMKGRLTFKELADAPRYLSNNTIFATNKDINKLNRELETTIYEIMGEDISERDKDSNLVIASGKQVHVELTTWLSKLILKMKGLDAKSVEGQNLINRLENWQILLGVFFPPIRNMFVGMHGEENREGVEQGLASVLDKVRDAFKTAVNVTIEEASGLSFAKKLSNFVIALRNPDLMRELDEAHKQWNLGVQTSLLNVDTEEIVIEGSKEERESIIEEIKRITGLDSNVQEDAMILSYLTNQDFDFLNRLFSMLKDNTKFQNKDFIIKFVHSNLIISLMNLHVIDFDEAVLCLDRIKPASVENLNNNNNNIILRQEKRAFILFLTDEKNIATLIDILNEAEELQNSDESEGLGVIIRDMLEKIVSNIEDEELFPLSIRLETFLEDLIIDLNIDDVDKITKKERRRSISKTFMFRLCDALNREVKLSLSDYSYIKDLLHYFKKGDLFGNQYESFVEFCKLKDSSKRKILKYIKDNCGTKSQSIGLAFEVMVEQTKRYEDGQYSEEEIDFVLELITSNVPPVTIGEDNRDFLMGEFNAILKFISNRSLNKKVFEFVSQQGKGKHRIFLLQIAFLNIDFGMEDVKHLIELGDKLFDENIILFNISDDVEELAIRMFLNYKIQEMNESVLLKFRIAQKMARTLYHVAGEDVLDITDEQLNLIMDKLIEDSTEKRGVASTISIFSEKTGTVSIHNKEATPDGNRRFTSAGLDKIFSLLGIERELKTDFVIEDDADAGKEKGLWLDSIENFLELLEENELSNIMFIFDGHGGENCLYLFGNDQKEKSNDVFISVEEVAQALFRAHKKCVERGKPDEIEKLILNLSSCNSYVFARKVIDRLEQLELDEQNRNPDFPIRLPQIITEAGKETKFGFTTTYKNSETGENFQLGNLEYSVIRFLENKIKNGEEPKRVTLQDLFDSEIYRSNHTIFLSNSEIEGLNESLRQYLRDVIGKGKQDKEQNINKKETNIPEYESNLEKNQQNQNMFDSSFGMLSKVLNLMLNMIRAIVDPTFLLRKLFPKNIKNNFVEKFLEKKLLDNKIQVYEEESVNAGDEQSVDTKQRFPTRATELTTWLSKLILKMKGLDAKSVEGQDLINRLENWQILLGVFFPPIRNMFVGMHGKENREGVEQGLASVLDKVRDAFKTAVNVTIEEASGLSFAKKLSNFVIALRNPDLMKKLADAHTEFNKGVGNANIEEITIPEQESKEESGREFSQEEITKNEQHLQKIISQNDIKYQYQPNPELKKDIEEIFGNLLDAMVAQGKITTEERQQYRIHYYYSPVANAYAVVNSKDVFLFSELIYELAEEMHKEGKKLTKDHIAAILAHELQHTTQENRIYDDYKATKGDGKRKEYDADRESIFILEQAGYNPRAVEEMMTALSLMSGSSLLEAFFDEHPNTKDRVKEISEILEDPSLVLLSMSANQQPMDVSSLAKYGQDFEEYLDKNIDKGSNHSYSLNAKALQKILDETDFFEQMSIFDMSKYINFYDRTTKEFIFNNILNGNYKFFTEGENNFIKNCSAEEKEFIYHLLFASSTIDNVVEKLENQQKMNLFDFCTNVLEFEKIRNPDILFSMVASMNPTQATLKAFLDFRENSGIKLSYTKETAYFYLTNYKYLLKGELSDLMEELIPRDKLGFLFENEDEYKLSMTFESFNQEQKNESIKIILKILKENKDLMLMGKDPMGFINFVMASDVLTKEEKLEYLLELSITIKKYEQEFGDILLDLFDDIYSDKSDFEKLVHLFEVLNASEKIGKLVDIFSYEKLITRYSISEHDFAAEELKDFAFTIKNFTISFDVFFLGYFLKLKNKDIKFYFVKDEESSHDKKYSNGVCLYPNINIENINRDLLKNMTLDDLIEFQNFMMDNHYYCQSVSLLARFVVDKVLNASDAEKIRVKKLLTLLPKGQESISLNGDVSAIPYEHLKNLVDIQNSYKDIDEQTRVLPVKETSFINFYVPFLEFRTFEPNYSAVPFEQIVENIKEHFDAYAYLKELLEAEENGEELEIYYSEGSGDMGNPDEPEQQIRNMEIEKAWLFELHRIFDLTPKEKNVEFNYEGETFVYAYLEMNEQLLGDAKFVPTAQQAQQLINAFSIIKKELPQETVDVYAKLIYSLLKRNSNLSVFSSAKANLELLDLLFEDFSVVKDDYITELLDNYDVTVEEYKEIISKTRLYFFGLNSRDNNKDIGNMEMINNILPTLSDSEKIKFFFWLLSGNDSYKPQMLRYDQVRIINFNYDGEINFSSLQQSFRLMTKTERENFIRKILLGSSGIIEQEKVTAERNAKEFEKGLKNILFDDFFISSLGGSSKIKASTISRVFKDVFSIVFNNLNYERKVLFVNNLISALAELKIDNKNANDEQKARQLGRLIVALGTSSGVAVVKLLQILSNNRVFEALDDKYGIIINEEVAKVKDENEPLSKSVLFQYLEKLGLSSSIEYVGKRLGSASIGLTYLLKLKDIKGLLVAKVKRPNINKSYDEDFDIADKLIEYFKNDSPLDDKYKKTLPNADKLRALFAEELKFEEESKNLADFSKQLEKRNSKIKVPQLIETVKDVTVHTQNLFLQTTAKGISLDKIKGSKKQKSRIYFEVLKEFFTEIFVDPIENGQALYHADLHTGNIFVDESGNISFIDLGGVGKVSAQQSKALKDIFMYLYSGNYDGFINALKLYNHEIYEQLEKESLAEENTLNKIKEILNRKTSLESKFVDLFEIFNSLEKIDNDFMMFIQAISKISAYLDNLDKKDQLSLLNNLSFNRGIQFKIILDNVLTAVVSTFKKIHFGKKQKEEEGHEITREDMFREKLLSNYPDINSEDIDLLLSLDPFVLEYIKNNTVSLTEEQLIKGATLADKLYKQQIITEQNNKINILFKIVSITSFSDKNIEKLLALDENTIEKIISEITEDEKIEIVFTKAEQLDIDLVYKNDTFGSENRNFDRLLTFVKGAKLNRSQDFFYMFDWETELRKANVLFGLPVDFAKILLKDERKLSFIADIVKNTDLSLDEDSDIINIIMSLSKEEIDNIEFEIRTLSGNGKKYIRRFFYMYRDYKNLFSGKDGARIIGSLIITNENDELLREMFNSAKNEETIEFIAYKGIDVYSRDGKFASETLLEIILFRCKALNIDIDVNNPAFVDTTKALNVITSTGQERISNLDEDTYKNLFSVKDQDSFIELLKYISQYSYYDRRGFESLLNKALSSERTEIEVSYDKNDHVIVLLIKKDDRTQYSVRLALARITEEDKVRQDYIKTGIPDRKMFVYLSSIGDNAFSKATTEYTTIEDIEKLTGVKIEVSGNTIVAKSMKTGTYISCVKNRDISQIVSSLKVQQIPVIDDQQKSDVENIANAEVTEAICLDESPEIILEKLKRAIENNSLIVIYPFSHTYDIDSLTNDELYALYFDIQNKFFDLQELLEDNNCLPNIDDRRNMAYVLKELIKNAFVHGNLSDTSNPMYVKFVRNGFTVINARHTSKDDKNRLRRLNLSAAATLTGAHRGLQIIQDYEKQGLIKVTPEQERNIEVGNKGYFVITAVKTTGDKSGFRSLMERVDSIATIKKDTDTKEAEEKNKRTIEYINGSNDNNMVAAQRAAEKVLAETFTPEELETVDLLASVIFDSIKYVNSPVNTSSIEFVNIVYALEEGLFNYNLFPNEGEDLKQHILKMLNHYVEVSKQKKGTGQDNILVKVLSEKETLLDDMADYLCDIIIEKNLIEKNKLETKQRKANMKRFIDGVKSDNMRFSAVMICSANENRSAIWHVMFKDFLEKYNKKSISVFSAGVFYDISQRFMNDNNTIETKPLVEDYIETLSSDERYRDINENLKNGFRSRYIKYLNIPKKSQPVFIVAGEQHRAQLIKLGYDPSWIFLMSDFYSEEFKRLFRAENIALARDLEENNIFSMSEFPDPYENQILRQDLPELVRSVVEYSFGGETVQQQIPEEFITLTDDYNQFEHMENLPDFAETKYAEERRQNTIQAFNEQIEDIYLKKHQFIFRGNTKYLYLLQNRKNKYVLMNIASQPGIDLKFRLFSLLYLDKLSRELTNEEKANVEKYEKAIVKKLKKQIEGNEFKVLNNLDLRAYMMGIYLILKEHAHKKNVPDIIDKAIIINFSDGKMGRDDGLFAEIDLFVVIHELTHRMFDKPKDWYRPVDEALDELVSYITPNMFLRKIMALPFNAYSERQKRYMMHQTDGIIDYINMGVKFHSLYSMFDKKANEYEIEQEVHSGPLAFLDYLFNAHQKIGKSVDWDTLLEVIDDLSVSKVEQLQMFRKILNSYLEYSIDKGLLTKEETETIKKEIEEMQTWTLLIREVIEIIEGSSPNSFNLLKGNKTALEYKSEILSKPNKMKENFEEVLRVLQWNSDFSKDELLVLLIMNIMKKVEYEQLVNNFDGVINGIIDVINNASGELKLDLGKNKYSRQEYQTILNFVLANYNVSDRIETSIADDIFVYISKNLDKFSFASKLINMVFGTENLTKIFGNKKLLIANSKQQEENLRKQLSNRNDIAVVTMEIINDRVYDIRKGIFLDVQKGIKAKYDSKENKITVYSKEGIKLTENEIKDLIMKQYFAERNEDSFDDVIAFAEIDDSSLQDITDRLHNAYTDSVSIPSKENVFDLSLRPIKNNLTTICKQEFISTGIKTFIITSDQVKDYIDEIQKLREQGFKFIISCKADNIIDITNYDGLIIDDSVKDYEDISQLLTLMERTKKQIVTQGVAKQVFVKFSNDTYGKFNSANIDIFDSYGAIPIVMDSYIVNSMLGKFTVEKIRDNDINIEMLIRKNNVIGFVVDNARLFADKKSKLRELLSKEHKYNKGYNASLSSKFDYVCYDVPKLETLLSIDINNEQQMATLQNINLENLELSPESFTYLNYLKNKGRYEEMLGFIRGIAMNSARVQIIGALTKQGANLDMDKFAEEAGGKYQKAFLTVAVQLMMSDIDITELLKTGFIDSDMTMKEYLDSVYEKVNINIEEILKQNEFKINKIKEEDTPKTIEDFKNYVVLLDNLKIVKETNANFDMSMKAVRNMLSAA